MLQYSDLSDLLDHCEHLDIHERRYDHNPISSIQFWNTTISVLLLHPYFHRNTVAYVRIKCLIFKKSSRDPIFRSVYDFYWSQSETGTIGTLKYMLHALEISSTFQIINCKLNNNGDVDIISQKSCFNSLFLRVVTIRGILNSLLCWHCATDLVN